MRWLWNDSTADRHLGIAQVAVRQSLFELGFDGPEGLPAGGDTANERERKGAVRLDLELAGHVRLVVDADRQDVLLADRVIGLARQRSRRERQDEENCANETCHCCVNPYVNDPPTRSPSYSRRTSGELRL